MAQLARRLLANLAGSWTAQLVRLPVTLALTPFLLGRLGDERYGAFGVILSLLAYLNLAGGPLHSSISREVANAGEDDERRSRVLSNAVLSSAIVAVLTAAVGFLLAGWFIDVLRVPATFRGQAIACYSALLGTVLLTQLTTPFVGLLVSRNRYDLVDLVPAVGYALYAALAVAAFALYGPSLERLGLAYLASHILSTAVLVLLALRTLGGARIGRGSLDRRELMSQLTFSAELLVINLSVLLTYQTDNIVISRLIGVGPVAHYVVASSLILRFRHLCYGLSRTFMPAAADPAATPERRRELHLRGTRYNALLVCGLGGAAAALAGPFYRAWLGPAYSQSAVVFVILMAANLVATSQYVTNSVLTGLRRTRGMMVSEVVGAVANVVLSIALVRAGMGLVGVALGTLVPMVIRNVWLAIHGARVVGARPGAYVRLAYGPAVLLLAVTVLLLRGLAGLGWAEGWLGVAGAGLLGLLLFALLGARFALDATDRAFLRASLRRRRTAGEARGEEDGAAAAGVAGAPNTDP